MQPTLVPLVAAEVRAHLARKRLSQVDFAAAVGISRAALSRKLAGDVPFTFGELVRVADHMGVALSALIASAEALDSEDVPA